MLTLNSVTSSFFYLMNTDEDIQHRSRRLRYKFRKISISNIWSCNILVVRTEFSNEFFLYLLDIDKDIRQTRRRAKFSDIISSVIWSCNILVVRNEFSNELLRGGGLGSRPKQMYGERLGDGVEYHLMSPTPRR